MRIKRQGKMPKEDLIREYRRHIGFPVAAIPSAPALFSSLSGKPDEWGSVHAGGHVDGAALTDGYVPGIVASIFGVICVTMCLRIRLWNWIYTDGYPVTFIAMFDLRYYKHHHHPFKRAEPHPDGVPRRRRGLTYWRAVSHDLRTR